MLYNPKWDQRTLLDRWIDWLETKPPEEAYEWCYPRGCACGQFYGSEAWVDQPGFAQLNSIAKGNGRLDNKADWTFGKCLARAKYYRNLMPAGWFANAFWRRPPLRSGGAFQWPRACALNSD